MKKYIAIIICLISFFILSACVSEEPDPISTEPIETETTYHYGIIVKSVETGYKDFEDKPLVKITYEFTNESDENTSMRFAADCTVFQNGVELPFSYSSNHDSYDNYLADIKPGVTIEVELYYELRDEISPIEIEISTPIDIYDDYPVDTFTFDISTENAK